MPKQRFLDAPIVPRIPLFPCGEEIDMEIEPHENLPEIKKQFDQRKRAKEKMWNNKIHF